MTMADDERGNSSEGGAVDAANQPVALEQELDQRWELRMQEMMNKMPLLLQAKSDGRGQEESGGAGRGAASGFGGIGEIVPGNRRELPAAVGVGLRDTAGGESRSRPGAEGEPVRALEVPAQGGFGGFQNSNSLCR